MDLIRMSFEASFPKRDDIEFNVGLGWYVGLCGYSSDKPRYGYTITEYNLAWKSWRECYKMRDSLDQPYEGGNLNDGAGSVGEDGAAKYESEKKGGSRKLAKKVAKKRYKHILIQVAARLEVVAHIASQLEPDPAVIKDVLEDSITGIYSVLNHSVK